MSSREQQQAAAAVHQQRRLRAVFNGSAGGVEGSNLTKGKGFWVLIDEGAG